MRPRYFCEQNCESKKFVKGSTAQEWFRCKLCQELFRSVELVYKHIEGTHYDQMISAGPAFTVEPKTSAAPKERGSRGVTTRYDPEQKNNNDPFAHQDPLTKIDDEDSTAESDKSENRLVNMVPKNSLMSVAVEQPDRLMGHFLPDGGANFLPQLPHCEEICEICDHGRCCLPFDHLEGHAMYSHFCFPCLCDYLYGNPVAKPPDLPVGHRHSSLILGDGNEQLDLGRLEPLDHEVPHCEVCDQETYALECPHCFLRICPRCRSFGSVCMCREEEVPQSERSMGYLMAQEPDLPVGHHHGSLIFGDGKEKGRSVGHLADEEYKELDLPTFCESVS